MKGETLTQVGTGPHARRAGYGCLSDIHEDRALRGGVGDRVALVGGGFGRSRCLLGASRRRGFSALAASVAVASVLAASPSTACSTAGPMANHARIFSSSPKKEPYQIMPAKAAPKASTPKGTSITAGDSCAWSCLCMSPRGVPQKVRNISRHE